MGRPCHTPHARGGQGGLGRSVPMLLESCSEFYYLDSCQWDFWAVGVTVAQKPQRKVVAALAHRRNARPRGPLAYLFL